MNNQIENNNDWLKSQKVKPLSKSYRFGAWFILVCGVFAITGAFIFGVIVEKDIRVLLMLIPLSIFTHIFGTLAVTGHAPKYSFFLVGNIAK